MTEKVEKEGMDESGETSLVPKKPFNQLLPKDFNLVAASPQIRAEQQSVFQNRSYTFGSAIERAQRMHPANFDESKDKFQALRGLVLSKANLPTLGQFDPLEEYRKENGLVERREYLISELLKTLSFETGLTRFSRSAERVTGHQYATMSDINRDYPHLTKTEIILLSLVTQAPDDYLHKGRSAEYRPQTEKEQKCHQVSLMAGASIDGFLFMDEVIDPNYLYPTNAYSQLGIVGASEAVEITPYTTRVKRIIGELIPLMITNYRLHERVWNNADSALTDGMSKLDRLALSKVLGHLPDKSVARLIFELAPDQRQSFQNEQDRLNKIIGRDILVNLQKGDSLEAADLVKLFGMIHQIPPHMLDENNPFRGYFTAFGPGILFMDGTGKMIFYTPYHPYYLREAMRGLHAEQTNAQRDNATMAILFNQLANHAEKMVDDEVEQTGEVPSLLEGVKIDAKLKFNIDLDIGPRAEMVLADVDAAYSSEGQRVHLHPVIKFGYEEAKQVFDTLSLLPHQMLKGIKRIRKMTKPLLLLTELLEGGDKLGEFTSFDQSVTLYQPSSEVYVNFTPELRALRSFTLIHEIAHSLWDKLRREEKQSWEKISWDEKFEPIEPTTNFLTMYSHVANPAEDFCDHFASFMLHGPEFRTKAETVISLQSKYNYLKNMFRQFTDQEIDYPEISPWTIAELVGPIDAQLKKLSEEEVVRLAEEAEMKNELLAREAKAKVSVRLDEGSVEDVVDVEEEDLEREPISLEEALQRDSEIDFRRGSILTIRDFFSGDLSEKRSVSLARRIYKLIEEEKLDQAYKAARRHIDDLEEWKDFVEEVKRIKEVIDSGQYPTRSIPQ